MITEILEKWCEENNIAVTTQQTAAFEEYARLLVEWNSKMNLTAITDEQDIAIKHFIDSISLLCCHTPADGERLIDIGTGAGFPGIPLRILCPAIRLTLLDSLNKRLLFLDEVCHTLKIDAELLHARAEEYGAKSAYREQYDTAVSRAVANLPALCEYCMPFVKVGGSFIAMKGPDGENELDSAQNAIAVLGGKTERIEKLTLSDGGQRTIILIRKIKPTPVKYPRRGVKINKQPL